VEFWQPRCHRAGQRNAICLNPEIEVSDLQCKQEGWADKLKEQSNEGCNISGRVRVNKVIGNIHLSPGRSFQANSHTFYELVPYLRDDGHPHDFGHNIHEFAFEGDDEYDIKKAEMSRQMKQRMGLNNNPLDGSSALVKVSCVFTYTIRGHCKC